MGKSGEPSSTSSAVSPARPRGSASGAPPDLRVESLLWSHGARLIAGVDEAGRGAWAGPVVAAAVVLPCDDDLLRMLAPLRPIGIDGLGSEPDLNGAVCISPSGLSLAREQAHPPDFSGVRDSKQLTAAQRAAADGVIRQVAVAVGVGVVPPTVVDEVGLSFAGQLAFWRAVENLPIQPDHLLVDGFPLWSPRYPQTAVVHGDARCLSVAAASVVAKVARDGLMSDLDREFPDYGFVTNRGYGTSKHARALRDFGPCAHHRRSYAPVSATLASDHA